MKLSWTDNKVGAGCSSDSVTIAGLQTYFKVAQRTASRKFYVRKLTLQKSATVFKATELKIICEHDERSMVQAEVQNYVDNFNITYMGLVDEIDEIISMVSLGQEKQKILSIRLKQLMDRTFRYRVLTKSNTFLQVKADQGTHRLITPAQILAEGWEVDEEDETNCAISYRKELDKG